MAHRGSSVTLAAGERMIRLRGLPVQVAVFGFGPKRTIPRLSISRMPIAPLTRTAPIFRPRPGSFSRILRSIGDLPMAQMTKRWDKNDDPIRSMTSGPKSGGFLDQKSSATHTRYVANDNRASRMVSYRSPPLPEKYTAARRLEWTPRLPVMAPTSCRSGQPTSLRVHVSSAGGRGAPPHPVDQIALRRMAPKRPPPLTPVLCWTPLPDAFG